jgi:hypothetical protein
VRDAEDESGNDNARGTSNNTGNGTNSNTNTNNGDSDAAAASANTPSNDAAGAPARVRIRARTLSQRRSRTSRMSVDGNDIEVDIGGAGRARARRLAELGEIVTKSRAHLYGVARFLSALHAANEASLVARGALLVPRTAFNSAAAVAGTSANEEFSAWDLRGANPVGITVTQVEPFFRGGQMSRKALPPLPIGNRPRFPLLRDAIEFQAPPLKLALPVASQGGSGSGDDAGAGRGDDPSRVLSTALPPQRSRVLREFLATIVLPPPPIETFSLCDFPFLMDASAKKAVLSVEAFAAMAGAVGSEMLQEMMLGPFAAAGGPFGRPSGGGAANSVSSSMSAGSGSGGGLSDAGSGGRGGGGSDGSGTADDDGAGVDGSGAAAPVRSSSSSSSSSSRAARLAALAANAATSSSSSSSSGSSSGSLPNSSSSSSSSSSSAPSSEDPLTEGGTPIAGTHVLTATPFFELSVRRDHLLEDAIAAIAKVRARPTLLLKPLKVSFVGESGEDAGGVRREFLYLVTDLLRSRLLQLGALADRGSGLLWPHASAVGSREAREFFVCLGCFTALAAHNSVHLPQVFPRAMMSIVLGEWISLDDIAGIDPQLARGMSGVLSCAPGEFDAVYGSLCFDISTSVSARGETTPLCPGGRELPVTVANREDYVRLYVDHALRGCVESLLGAFAFGLLRVVGSPSLWLFRPAELDLLVSGSAKVDFEAVRDAAAYAGGYSAASPTVVEFWRVVIEDLTDDERSGLLAFATGSARGPISGTVELIIQRSGTDTERLPSASTCFQILHLPPYRSRAVLKDKLLKAIAFSQTGFGLV